MPTPTTYRGIYFGASECNSAHKQEVRQSNRSKSSGESGRRLGAKNILARSMELNKRRNLRQSCRLSGIFGTGFRRQADNSVFNGGFDF